jgi:prevent-host-death family protein
MKTANILELRQSLGRIVARLERGGEPIVLEKRQRPVAVLISLRDFEQRFVEKSASMAREELALGIDAIARPAADKTPAENVLRSLRGRA